ncbi:MAG: methyltransferase [Candidatus Marinimicrobia bacterium]|jgi:16S rRNA (guanine966-N2)-methyltransferase|nr:methyltransferase [Candidatus Neomarinimicrobiota bacterium]MBT3796809.1 methyltransferase [Candidatus Neomarinimicrobiota bacterium]MBT4318811.1 methyltransferase [Candidatus Neomarinimicrobiota bacterium]MBT5097226.1 methyltransferase [Candidatus Neomarinimicrobiota bacterium]MBT5441015.1 methyltransferase [Candidatus Neomarinimicrobiota bacterium]
MQIQAGLYKGRRVKTVKNAPYRPTASTVRKSLFDILGNLKGKCVLDLFAGSGIVGFEAASRGASPITFVESSMRVNSLLKINGSLFKQTDFKYIKQDATKFITKCGDYDIIFADPPYDSDFVDKFISDAIQHLNKDGILILESSIKEYSISPYRIKEYGDTQLTFWRNE